MVLFLTKGTQTDTKDDGKAKIVSSTPRKKRKIEETFDFGIDSDDAMPDPIDKSGSMYEPSYSMDESTGSQDITDRYITLVFCIDH